MLTRRAAITGTLSALAAVQARAGEAKLTAKAAQRALAKLEESAGGLLGVAILNIAGGTRAGHRQHERFLLCSTFKAMAAAFVLSRVDSKEERLDRRISFSKGDLIDWSPASEKRTGAPGMSVAELCEAAVTLSDNTAANLLLESFGGPAALTGYFRSLGDRVSRLDRTEPALNEHDRPGDVRDTTTPAAMLENLRTLLFGKALSGSSRAQLAAWLISSKTGDRRLRAGFPADWLVGDKTGTNRSGNANDIGVAWPPAGGAVIVAAYYRNPQSSGERRDAVLAEAARIAARM